MCFLMSHRTALRVLLSLAAGGGLCGAACGDVAAPKGPWENWSTLRLKAKGGALFSGRVEMTLSDAPGGRRLETEATAKFLGATLVRSWTESVFDGSTGRTRSYCSYSPKRGRRFVFGKEGYTVEKLSPPKGRGVPVDEWEVTSRAEFPFPASGGPVAVPHDYYGTLIHLRELELNRPGDEAAVYIATTKGAQLFRVLVAERRTRERSYTDLTTGEKETNAVEEFLLRIIPEDPESDEGFLSMEGETEIWVEAKSKTPIEISGKVPKVGRVKLLLTAMG